MKILTRNDLAEMAAARWQKQYPNTKEDIYINLIELGSEPTPEQVNEVIGNSAWTRLGCDSCLKSVDKVVVFSLPCHDQPFVHICENCANEIVKTFEGSK